MSLADDLVSQAEEWLSVGDTKTELHILLDLPDMGWQIVEKLERSEDLLQMRVHASLTYGLKGKEVQVACGVDAVKAIRLEPSAEARMIDATNLF